MPAALEKDSKRTRSYVSSQALNMRCVHKKCLRGPSLVERWNLNVLFFEWARGCFIFAKPPSRYIGYLIGTLFNPRLSTVRSEDSL